MAIGKGCPNTILLEEQVKALIAAGTPAKMFAKKRVLVLTPDATRTCPLPMMIRAIQEVMGTKVVKLDFMVALGTHTPLPEKKILKLYGITTQQRQAQFRNSLFLNHRWDRPQTFQRIGYLSAEDVETVSQGRLREKVPIDINKKIYDYDLIVNGIERSGGVHTSGDGYDRLAIYCHDDYSDEFYFDEFFVRKYCDPEPTWGAWGEEEPDISVSPVSYDFGNVSESSTYNTTTGYFNITNGSSVQTDQTISVTGGNWTGGINWTHSDTCIPGLDTAGLKANRNGTWGSGDVVVKYSSPEYIYEDCPASTDYSFGLSLHTPTSFSDGQEKTITIRITAVAG